MKRPPEHTEQAKVADGEEEERIGTDGFSTADILDSKLVTPFLGYLKLIL